MLPSDAPQAISPPSKAYKTIALFFIAARDRSNSHAVRQVPEIADYADLSRDLSVTPLSRLEGVF
jgi:hypothetical protein